MLILHLLNERDLYSYEINSILSSKSNGIYKTENNCSTITLILHKLEDENYISSYIKFVNKQRFRVYFHIEDKGKNYTKNY